MFLCIYNLGFILDGRLLDLNVVAGFGEILMPSVK